MLSGFKLFWIALAPIFLISAAALNASTACTSFTNVSNQDILNFNLSNVNYNFVENYVTPDYAGFTINGASYNNVAPNSTITLSSGTGAYIMILQINYLPIQKSINVIVCSAPQGQNTYYNFSISDNSYGDLYFTYFGTKLILSSNSTASVRSNVTITNITTSTPSPPVGYVKLTALNIAVNSAAPTTLNVTQAGPCPIIGKVSAYTLAGTWVSIPNYRINPVACTISFFVPYGHIIGIFYYSPQQTTTFVSTASTTSASTSTTSATSTSSASTSTTSTSTTTVPPGYCTQDIQCPLITNSCTSNYCLVNKCVNNQCRAISILTSSNSTSANQLQTPSIGRYLAYLQPDMDYLQQSNLMLPLGTGAAMVVLITLYLLTRHFLFGKKLDSKKAKSKA